MNPPVVWFVIMYGAGLATGLVFLVPWWAIVMLAIGVMGGLWRDRWWAALAAMLVVGALAGAHGARAHAGSCAVSWGGGTRAALLRMRDEPDGRGLGVADVLHAPEGCGGNVRVRVEDGAIRSGDRFVAVGSFYPAGPLRVRRFHVLAGARPWRYVVRDLIAARARRLYGARAPLVEALVLGRRGDLDPALRTRFVDAGLAHLLAISGLHVGLVAGWLLWGARMAGAGRGAWIVAAACTWCYVGLLGFPAPATRAAGFVTLYGLSRVRQRNPAPGAVLAVAMLAVMLLSPRSITGVGTWLSVFAVLGAAGVVRHLPPRLQRSRVATLAATSVGATLGTAPITALVFGSLAPIGVLTNLVAVPLAGIAVPGVFASLVFGGTLAGGAGVGLAAIERVAAIGAAVPGGHLEGTAGMAFAAPWGALALVVTWFVRRRPTWAVVERRALATGVIGAWAAFVMVAWPARDGNGVLTMYVLDVGQGDAIALRSPRGRWILIDGGPRGTAGDAGVRVVLPFLRAHGVRELDAVIVSHGDADHLGGVPAVLRRTPTARVLEPGQPLTSALYAEFLATTHDIGTAWTPARAGDTLEVDGVTLAILHPSAGWIRRELRPNENSVVVRVSYRAFDAILTGDAGWPAESALVATTTQVEVLKVGHHGSAGSSTERWLDVVRPKAAVVSVGQNGYGHPAPVVLGRFDTRGIPLFRTDRGGTVTIRTDGGYFQVTQSTPPTTATARLRCLVRRLSRSRASSSSRNGCTPRQPGTSPTSFTTWPSPRN